MGFDINEYIILSSNGNLLLDYNFQITDMITANLCKYVTSICTFFKYSGGIFIRSPFIFIKYCKFNVYIYKSDLLLSLIVTQTENFEFYYNNVYKKLKQILYYLLTTFQEKYSRELNILLKTGEGNISKAIRV